MVDFVIYSFAGFFFGVFNGLLSNYFIKKNIKASNKKFYTVYLILFLYKFLFILVSVWLMREQKVIIILLYCTMVVLTQMAVIFICFKNYGIKRDS